MKNVTPLLEKYSLREIIRNENLDFSPQSFSNRIRKNPPFRVPYSLTKYKCIQCKSRWGLWRIFYGRLSKLECPDCQGPCRQAFSAPMPDIFLQIEQNVLWNGGVSTFEGVVLKYFHEQLNDCTLPKFPIYIDQPKTNKPHRCLHIVFKWGEDIWYTHCHRRFTTKKARPLNSRDPAFDTGRVCLVCLRKLLSYRSENAWVPIPLEHRRSSNYKEIKLIIDAGKMGNIQLACDHHKVSPRVYYNAIEKHNDLHHALILSGI